MENAVARTSHMPIWFGVIVGALIGLAGGISFRRRRNARIRVRLCAVRTQSRIVRERGLNTRIGALLERVSLLEYSVKRLRRSRRRQVK